MQEKYWQISADLHTVENSQVGRSSHPNIKRFYMPLMFQLLGPDGEVRFKGRASENCQYEPLDQFGNPEFGCTGIAYLINGEWCEL